MKLNIPPNLGFHSTSDPMDFEITIPSNMLFCRTFQFFSSDPRSLDPPRVGHVSRILAYAKEFDLSLVFHAPYETRVFFDGYRSEQTLGYILAFFEACRLLEVVAPPLVVHTGVAALPVQEALDGVSRFTFALAEEALRRGLSIQVLYENNAYPNEACTLHGLSRCIRGLEGFRIAFDTQHSYASGHVPTWDYFEPYADLVSCVHLNQSPQEVAFGGGLDRHSYTGLRDGNIPVQELEAIFLWCCRQNVPVILERWPSGIIMDDLKHLGGIL